MTIQYVSATSGELNRRIAERLGYRVEFHEHTSRWESDYDGGYRGGDTPGFVLLEPGEEYDGDDLNDLPQGFDSEAQAWEEVPSWASKYGEYGNDGTFILFKECSYNIHRLKVHYQAEVENLPPYTFIFQMTHEGREFRVSDPNLSRAMAKCWLEWKELPND